MEFDKIFDVLSRRNRKASRYIYCVPETLRNKVLLLSKKLSINELVEYNTGSYTLEFWDEIHEALLFLHGRTHLINNERDLSSGEDTIAFLLLCKDEEFLDFIELVFKAKYLFHLVSDENILVSKFNELFISENVGYELTNIVKQEVFKENLGFPLHGSGYVTQVISYPKIIKKDDELIHSEVLKPVLNLLSDPRYKTANVEFLDALEDYRKGDYGDCLTKSCSAFESVMKIICNNKGWKYKQTDSAGDLIKIMMDKLKIESYFESLFMIIATLRNRLSKSHGAGVQIKTASPNLARYSLNSTASAIIFLVNEVK